MHVVRGLMVRTNWFIKVMRKFIRSGVSQILNRKSGVLCKQLGNKMWCEDMQNELVNHQTIHHVDP